MNSFQNENCSQNPYALCVQMFRRNPIHAFSEDEEPSQIHTKNRWYVMSYYDGMCISPIAETKSIVDDDLCIQCTNKCSLKEMAVHCEKKRLYLLSQTAIWKRAWKHGGVLEGESGRSYIETHMPCIAVIGVKSWNRTPSFLGSVIEEALSKEFFDKQHPGKRLREDIWYQCFSSIGLNDSYILLYINDVNHIETVVNAIQMQCSMSSTLIKTYSTFGINKHFDPAKSRCASKRYEFIIRLITLPGLECDNMMNSIKQELGKRNIAAHVKSTMGSYDIEIKAHMSLAEYASFLQRGQLLGWDNPITLRSNSHIYFSNRHNATEYTNNPHLDSQRKQYNQLVQECRTWLNERHQNYQLLNPRSDIVWKNFGSVYTLACQRLASPQTWMKFSDVRLFLENYLKLLMSSLENYRSHQIGINKSLSTMTRELYVLANERLSIEGPSSEKIADSVYEKGAYEKIICAWSAWLNHLSVIARELTDKLDLRPVSFMIIPYMHGQTRSLNHMEFNHSDDAPRSIVINLSVREMFNIHNLLLTFAHEVGHYCAIAYRKQRVLSYVRCVTTSGILATHYVWRPDGGTSPKQQVTKMDDSEMTWLALLCKEVIHILDSDLRGSTYLDECTNTIEERLLEAFGSTQTQNPVSESLKIRFLKCCPVLCEDTETYESYGYRLSKMVSRRCREFMSIFREVNADLFMLHSLNPDPLAYLDIIVDQATTYLDFDLVLSQLERTDVNILPNDNNVESFWFTLYMRLFCCIMCFYVRDTDSGISTNSPLASYLNALISQAELNHAHRNVLRLLRCLANQIKSLNEYENGDYLCLLELNDYAQLTINSFENHTQTSLEKIRDTYQKISNLAKTNSLAALNCFLNSTDELKRMGGSSERD